MRYDGREYDRPELLWTRRVVSQNQMLVWDRTFYDPEQRRYTVDRYLADVESRLGPIDAVLIWHVYPNLGVDERNSFDLLRDLPGGLPALKDVVDQFHRRGVKVFFPILAWDTSTRPEGQPVWTALVEVLKEIGADGINFDTLESAPGRVPPGLRWPRGIPWRWSRSSPYATSPSSGARSAGATGSPGRTSTTRSCPW